MHAPWNSATTSQCALVWTQPCHGDPPWVRTWGGFQHQKLSQIPTPLNYPTMLERHKVGKIHTRHTPWGPTSTHFTTRG